MDGLSSAKAFKVIIKFDKRQLVMTRKNLVIVVTIF